MQLAQDFTELSKSIGPWGAIAVLATLGLAAAAWKLLSPLSIEAAAGVKAIAARHVSLLDNLELWMKGMHEDVRDVKANMSEVKSALHEALAAKR